MPMEPRALLQDQADKKVSFVMTHSRSLSRYNDNIIRHPSLPLLTTKLPLWQVLKEKIDQLKLQGENFDFAKHAPDDRTNKKDMENRSKKTWPKERYHWPVMFFLFLYSFIFCSCCIIIMCWQKIDKFGDTWTNTSPGGNYEDICHTFWMVRTHGCWSPFHSSKIMVSCHQCRVKQIVLIPILGCNGPVLNYTEHDMWCHMAFYVFVVTFFSDTFYK